MNERPMHDASNRKQANMSIESRDGATIGTPAVYHYLSYSMLLKRRRAIDDSASLHTDHEPKRRFGLLRPYLPSAAAADPPSVRFVACISALLLLTAPLKS